MGEDDGITPGRRHRELLLDLVLLLALVVAAGGLRLHQFDRIPYPNETADEYAYVWTGWSWLHEGTPTAWSEKPAYGPTAPIYLWQQSQYRLVAPWLDQPPLYSLLAGAVSSLARAPELLDNTLVPARLLSVALGTIAVALLYFLARSAYGRGVAVLAGALYATVPTVVLASRLAVTESLLVVLLLLTVLATQRYLAVGGRGWLAVAALAAGVATSTKVPGLAAGVSAALLLLPARRWRPAAIVGLSALAGLLPYFAYGYASNRALFQAVLADQASRASGLEVLPRLLVSNAVVLAEWRDSWIPVLWLALAYATFRQDRLLAAATGPYLLALVAAADQRMLAGWYREPLYPFLCLAGGIFLRDTLLQPDALRVALVLFGATFGKLAEAFGAWNLLGQASLGQRLYPALVAALGAVAFAGLALAWKPARRATTALVAVTLAVSLAANVAVVMRADELYPPFRPRPIQGRTATTNAGLLLVRFAVEPISAVAPGDWLRVSTTWYAERDVADLPVSGYLRPFDRRSGRYGDPAPFGREVGIRGLAGEEPAVEVAGLVPPDLREGDYEVGVRVGESPVSLGVVRVRSSAATGEALRTVALPATFDSTFALDRAVMAQPRLASAGTVYPILLLLETRRPIAVNCDVVLQLRAEDGRTVVQSEALAGGRDAAFWRVGEVVEDWRDLLVPASTPPGRYYLSLGLIEPIGRRWLRTGTGGDAVPLGVIDVGRPLAEADVPHRLDTRLAGGLELVGYGLPPADDAGKLRLTLYWRAAGPIPRDYSVFVHLADPSGKPIAQADGPPAGGRAPTSSWRQGQVIADTHVVDLAGVPSGTYRLLIGLYEAPDGPRLPVLGRADDAIEVTGVLVP